MSFHVGQRVVCVNAKRPAGRTYYNDEVFPVTGGVYTIRSMFIRQKTGALLLRLYEIVNKEGEYDEGFQEAGFNCSRFRPVRDTDISIFTAMLNPVPKKELETIPARTSVSLSTGNHRPSCAERCR